MQRLALVLAVLLMVLAAASLATAQDGGEWLAPPEVDGETVYIPFNVPITLDGDLSDWAGVQPITVTRGPSTSGDPANNGAFTFGVAADQDTLYVYMTSPDQNIITGQHDANYWNEDSMEFYLNLSGDLAATAYTAGVFQINLKPLDIGNTDPAGLNITGTSGVRRSGDRRGVQDRRRLGLRGGASPWRSMVSSRRTALAIGFQAQANGATTKDRDFKADLVESRHGR